MKETTSTMMCSVCSKDVKQAFRVSCPCGEQVFICYPCIDTHKGKRNISHKAIALHRGRDH